MFDYIQKFPFKNLFALPLTTGLLYLMVTVPALHDSCVVLLTLIVKYYYDSSSASSKKDETISKALIASQQLPGPGQTSAPTTVINANEGSNVGPVATPDAAQGQ